MRLIDADKLEEKIDDISRGYTSVYGVEEDDIYNAETIEAIPVDWLMKKADWCDKNNGIFVSGAIRSAVDAWREEQKNKGER